jgi:23S rRNA (uracil1939-C5)-methyltransferase
MGELMSEHEIHIDKMAFGGAGIGRVNGKICFVPFTAVGDTAAIRIKTEKKSYCEAELLHIIEPSPLRADPPCPVFGKCGGCDWQHLEYAAQLQAKQELFSEILWRNARVEADRILPIIGAPQPYGYRSRIQLKMTCVEGKILIGFYKAGTHHVVAVPQECAIACPAVNRTLQELRDMLYAFPEPEKIPQIDISSGDDGAVLLIFHYIGDNREKIRAFLDDNRHRLSLTRGIFLQYGRKNSLERVFGMETISYSLSGELFNGLPGMCLSTSRGGFSQVNYRQNSALIDTALQWTRPGDKDKILDLYCGNGNFSLALARFAGSVTGFEDYDQSIRDAENNRMKNGLSNLRFECIDSVAGIKKLAAAGERFSIAVLDPPRTGAAEAVQVIPGLNPAKILYISCDPPTLARDIALLKKSGYGVTKSVPVDMFPQTYHLESVTLLEKL